MLLWSQRLAMTDSWEFLHELSHSDPPAPHQIHQKTLRLSFKPPLTQRAFQQFAPSWFGEERTGHSLFIYKNPPKIIFPNLFKQVNPASEVRCAIPVSFIAFDPHCNARIRCVCVSPSHRFLLPPPKKHLQWHERVSMEAVAPIQGQQRTAGKAWPSKRFTWLSIT